jgi:hypothetical protein
VIADSKQAAIEFPLNIRVSVWHCGVMLHAFLDPSRPSLT